MVALNNWSVFSTKSLSTFPASSLNYFASYLVDRVSLSEGILLSLYLVSWSLVTRTNIVDSLSCILVAYNFLSRVLQVNNEVVAFLSVYFLAI